MDDPKKPPASKVYEIADRTGTPEEIIQLLATAFPEAETGYIADLFRQRADEQSKLAERYELEGKASKAVMDFLRDGGFENPLEASNDLGLTLQELWDQIMQEASIPKHEMPETIQIGWEH